MAKTKLQSLLQNINQRLHSEPHCLYPKMKTVPNIVLNLLSLIISLSVVIALLYLLVKVLANLFYHLK